MKFVVQEGCCSSSLKRTCLVIGIVCLVLGIVNTSCGAYFTSNRIILSFDIIYIVAAICLIIATFVNIKWLVIPWFIGYICTLIVLLIIILADFLSLFASEDEKVSSENDSILRLVLYIIRFIIETILLRYVYSYYLQLE